MRKLMLVEIVYWIALVCGVLFAAAAFAKPANTECVASDGSRIYIVASNGNIMIQWDNGEWHEAFAEVKGDLITVVQIAPNGMAVVSWNYKDNRAYAIVENSKTGKRIEKNARCWFK
jgi:uncharacterized protein YycO